MTTWLKIKDGARGFCSRCCARLKRPRFSAGAEVLFTLIISNFALAVSLFVAYLIDRNAVFSLSAASEIFVSNVKPTEVLVYILAVITPTLWYMIVTARARKYLSGFTWIIVLQCFLILLSSIVYALAKTGLALNEGVVVPFAWISFIGAVIIWYRVLVFQRNVEDGPHIDAEDMSRGTSISSIKRGLEL